MSTRRENCILLGLYAESRGSFVLTFQEKVSARSSRVKNPKKESWSSHYGVYIGKNVGSGNSQ